VIFADRCYAKEVAAIAGHRQWLDEADRRAARSLHPDMQFQ